MLSNGAEKMTGTEPMTEADVFSVDPARFSVEELRRMISKGDGPLPKVLALSVLRQKTYPNMVKDFQRVMLNEHESPAVRHAAALELGRIGSTQAVAALRKGVKAKHELVARGAATALTIAGEAPPVSRKPAMRWLQRFHRYKTNATGPGITFPKASSFIRLGEASEVTFRSANRNEAALAIKQIAGAGRDLPLSAASAVALRCGERTLMFLPTETLASGDLVKEGFKRQAAVGVVASHHTVETDTWSPKYYILCQPSRKRNELQMLLTTSTGTLAFAGTARIDGEHASFKLKTVKHPGAVPAEVEGTYDRGKVRFARIRAEERMVRAITPSTRKR